MLLIYLVITTHSKHYVGNAAEVLVTHGSLLLMQYVHNGKGSAFLQDV